MADHPEAPRDSEDDDDGSEPVQGQVRHSNVSARVPEDIGNGVFSNGVMILTGNFEIILDFVLRMGELQRIVSRIVIPHQVAKQFAKALNENIGNYEKRFGPLPPMPKPLPKDDPPRVDGHSRESSEMIDNGDADPSEGLGSSPAIPDPESHPENRPAPPSKPQIEDIYDDLKLPDEMLSGRYANAVLIRHSGTEFCFDFITNMYPRSAVSARVFLAAPHAGSFLSSLNRSISPPGTSQDFA